MRRESRVHAEAAPHSLIRPHRLAIALGAALAVAAAPAGAEPTRTEGRVLADRVVAVVGDVHVFASELEDRVGLLGKLAEVPTDKRDARWQTEAHALMIRVLVDEALITRDLERIKVTVTDADVTRAVATAAEREKRTEADLFAEATAKGLTREEFLGEIRRWVIASRWTKEAVIPRLDPKIATDPKLFEPGVEARRREILDDLRRRTYIEVRQ